DVCSSDLGWYCPRLKTYTAHASAQPPQAKPVPISRSNAIHTPHGKPPFRSETEPRPNTRRFTIRSIQMTINGPKIMTGLLMILPPSGCGSCLMIVSSVVMVVFGVATNQHG